MNHNHRHSTPDWRHRSNFLLRLGGLTALIWFLIRVLPKPSRAAYPCQRAAAPAAAAFVLWIMTALGSLSLFRYACRRLRHARWQVAMPLIFIAVVAASGFFVSFPEGILRAAVVKHAPFVPADLPNTPMGKAFGIKPGRVAWAHDPAAATWGRIGSLVGGPLSPARP